MTKRKICVVTTSRADYGLLFQLLKEIEAENELELQLVVSGMHLSPEFGSTCKVIEQDGFQIARKIEMLLSADTASAMSKSIGLGLISFTDALMSLQPDILVLLGDRFELFAPAVAAVMQRIPIAHLHGGESSQGVVDECVRHSLTKMASLHFVSADAHRQRVVQMGENPEFVFNFGAPGLDAIHTTEPMSKDALQDTLGIDINKPTAMITYHPVTLEKRSGGEQIDHLLAALEEHQVNAVFTKANADAMGRTINDKLKAFCLGKPQRYMLVDNLGHEKYLSCLKHLDLMIGNSSSGLIEAPSFGMPVVNIGDRQRGRLRAENVIDCKNEKQDISDAIRKALSSPFRSRAKSCQNPYDKFGDGKSSVRIKNALKTVALSTELLQKTFYDIDFPLD